MIVKTQKRAAKLLSIHPRTLRRWRDLKGFPDCSKGYDVSAIGRWRRTRKIFTDEEFAESVRELDREWPAFRRQIRLETFDLDALDLEMPNVESLPDEMDAE